MKHLLLLLVLSVITIGAGAKIIVTNSEYAAVSKTRPRNSFLNTKLDMKGNNLIFKGLPKNKMDYYVIDAHGKVESSGTMSRKNNMLDAPLSNGNHTIVLKQGASVRLFGWLAEVAINGTK